MIKKLLKLDRRIEIFNCCDKIGVTYQNSEIKDGCLLISVFGKGNTVEEAVVDYYSKISGKTLIFDSMTEKAKEITVL